MIVFDSDKLTILIALVAVAILIQAGVLFGIFMAVRRMKALAENFQRRAMPIVEQGRELAVDLAPKIRQVSTHVLETSVLVREQAQEIAKTVALANEKARVQIEHADELVRDTVAKVERTSAAVESGVMTPVRKVQGVIQGVQAAVSTLRGAAPREPRTYGDGEDFV